MIKKPYKAIEVSLPCGGENIQFLRTFITHANCQTFAYMSLITDQYRTLSPESVRLFLPALQHSRHIEFLIFTSVFTRDALSELAKTLPNMPRLKGIGFRRVLQPQVHDLPE